MVDVATRPKRPRQLDDGSSIVVYMIGLLYVGVFPSHRSDDQRRSGGLRVFHVVAARAAQRQIEGQPLWTSPTPPPVTTAGAV